MKKEILDYRALSILVNDSGIPATLDTETRSVEIIAATENPVLVYDRERHEMIEEVLLMSGVQMAESRQVPLLDSHQRCDTSSVIGSIRDLKVSGSRMIGRAYFSSVPEAESPYTKVREGHLTDFSIGYQVSEAERIPGGESTKINGKIYQGPLKVATKWTAKEVSTVPIGADRDAKSRGIPREEGGKRIMKIDEKLRAILVARGLPEDATDEEVLAFMEKLTLPDEEKESRETKTVIETKTDEDLIREAIAAERGRVQEIKAMCQRFQCDLADNLIAKGTSLEETRKAVMDHVAKTMETAGGAGYRPSVEILQTERDKFRAAAQGALIIRAGLPGSSAVETSIPGARELAGYSLRELAREALVRANQRPAGNVLEMVGRALTVSDFPYILANVANKALFAGWETNEETWQAWCATGQVSDFKTNYSPRVSESSDLEEVPESAEYRYGKRTEAQESYSIATYGKLFAISRQTIINDDLGALTNTPLTHGEAAARKVGDIVYAVLTANAAMGDGVALFHAGHSNLAGAGAAPGVATIAAGILAMGTQKDLQALRRLNIRPQFFIAPKALEGPSEIFFRSGAFADTNTIATDSSLAATRVNPYAGAYFSRAYDPRLDDVSVTAWYLAARKGRTVVLYFLNGVQTPYMETKQGWSVDGVEYKVRIDAGAKAMDWRGLYKDDGA